MIKRARNTFREYPFQFWVLFLGRFISAAGGSLVWPFMTIYLRQKFDIPLSTVGTLFAIWALVGLGSTAFAGPFVDRVGRRWALVGTMAMSAPIMLGLGLANSLEIIFLLFLVSAVFDPFSGTASNAMIADLVESERRSRAYALLRMIANLGVAIGPAIGGFLATRSYLLSFLGAAAADAVVFVIALLFIRETKPLVVAHPGETKGEGIGYGPVLRDYQFLALCGAYSLVTIAYAQMMLFLPVYMKESFTIPESQWGLIMATNAAMVVFFQFSITRIMDRYRRPIALAWGGFFTAMGVGSVALGNSFPLFLLSMVILTIGEMIIIPTSQAYVADLAPVTMRGRYMGVFGLTWGVGFGLGPVLGGSLSDSFGQVTIWYFGLTMGLASALAFLVMAAKVRPAVVPAYTLDPEVAETQPYP
ncbi:MAG: MFS transporter [Chloroflexi bacterium]|nr:MFS transporter [Chloroflexota bacterium]